MNLEGGLKLAIFDLQPSFWGLNRSEFNPQTSHGVPKNLDNFKAFKIKYPPCKLTRQKRWPLGDLFLQKKNMFFGKSFLYINRNILSNRALLYFAPKHAARDLSWCGADSKEASQSNDDF